MIGSTSNKAVLHRPCATRIGGINAQGMSMIEVLVSVMVLGVGLLGIAAMQSIALRGGQGSLESSQAVMGSNSIIESMRANIGVSYNLAKTCKPADVSGTTLMANDQRAWIAGRRRGRDRARPRVALARADPFHGDKDRRRSALRHAQMEAGRDRKGNARLREE